MKLFCSLFLAALCLVEAKGRRKRENGCRLPKRSETDCNNMIVDCEDQLEEVSLGRGRVSLTCLDINSMTRSQFSGVSDNCAVMRTCKCTVAYYLHCDYNKVLYVGVLPLQRKGAPGGDGGSDPNANRVYNELYQASQAGKDGVKIDMGDKFSSKQIAQWLRDNGVNSDVDLSCTGASCTFQNIAGIPAPPGSSPGSAVGGGAGGGGGGGGGGCFSGDTSVETPSGPMTLRALRGKLNAVVKVMDSNGVPAMESVIGWLHSEERVEKFVTIQTETGKLQLTDKHVIYTVPCAGGIEETKYADEVNVGECLLAEEEGHLVPRQVRWVEKTVGTGYYAPVTSSGNLIVNGIKASCYADFKHVKTAHFIFRLLFWAESLLKGGVGLNDWAVHALVAAYSL